MSGANMHAWFGAGHFPETQQVAPSYYGEVPETFWPISELYEDPNPDAFVLARLRPCALAPLHLYVCPGANCSEGAKARVSGRA